MLERKIPLLTSNLVLAEVHRLLLFRAGIAPAAAALARIDMSPGVTVIFADDAIHRQAQEWIARLDDQVISYTDATSFSLMEARHCRAALSFDHDFVRAGYSLWDGD